MSTLFMRRGLLLDKVRRLGDDVCRLVEEVEEFEQV